MQNKRTNGNIVASVASSVLHPFFLAIAKVRVNFGLALLVFFVCTHCKKVCFCVALRDQYESMKSFEIGTRRCFLCCNLPDTESELFHRFFGTKKYFCRAILNPFATRKEMMMTLKAGKQSGTVVTFFLRQDIRARSDRLHSIMLGKKNMKHFPWSANPLFTPSFSP